jgi:hypothetical protein
MAHHEMITFGARGFQYCQPKCTVLQLQELGLEMESEKKKALLGSEDAPESAGHERVHERIAEREEKPVPLWPCVPCSLFLLHNYRRWTCMQELLCRNAESHERYLQCRH